MSFVGHEYVRERVVVQEDVICKDGVGSDGSEDTSEDDQMQ